MVKFYFLFHIFDGFRKFRHVLADYFPTFLEYDYVELLSESDPRFWCGHFDEVR